MPVTFDATSNNGAPTTILQSWTHTPVGTPRGVVVFVVTDVGVTDEVVSVTYGIKSLTQVSGSPLLGTNGAETGSVGIWFAGDTIPTGAQTVTVTVDATGSSKTSWAVTLTSDGYDIILDPFQGAQGLDSNSTTAPSCGSFTYSTGYSPGFAIGGMHSGALGAAITPETGYTQDRERSFGAATASGIHRTLNLDQGFGSYSNLVQWAVSPADEAHCLGILLTEDNRIWVPIGQVTETDTAQTHGRRKSKTLGQATQVDIVIAVSQLKSKLLGQTTETDTVTTLTRRKSQTLGQNTETDLSQTVTVLLVGGNSYWFCRQFMMED